MPSAQAGKQFIHGATVPSTGIFVLNVIHCMLVVALVFTIVFLFRDVQVLAIRNRAFFRRFAGYALLLMAAVALMAGSGAAGPGIFRSWTDRKFASVGVLIQLAELAAGLALRRFALGRYSWIGCVLPAPAFLVVLFALSFAIQDHFIAIDSTMALEIVTGFWLALVGGAAMLLNWIDNPWEDRKFANDFALLTSCTALVFVPFGLS
jgi:hypothetical protein